METPTDNDGVCNGAGNCQPQRNFWGDCWEMTTVCKECNVEDGFTHWDKLETNTSIQTYPCITPGCKSEWAHIKEVRKIDE